MKKSQIISLFAATAFAVAVPSAAFALDADACGDQVPDALEQKAVDSANPADQFEEEAPLAASSAAPSQEPVAASQAKPAGELATNEATQGDSGEQGEQPSYSEGWNAVGSDWYFVRNGALVSGWEYINGHWYWFDSSAGCKMATGWIELSGSRYYLAQGGDFQGAMATGWLYDGGAWYYAKDSGRMAGGWELIGGAWYWLDSDNGCAMAQGCVTVDGQDYLLGEYGLVDGWVSYAGTWYYGRDGQPETGWLKLGGTWYWLDPSAHGAMATGWQELDGTWYYLNDQGIMQTGWLYWDGHWYLLDNSGAMQTGWNYVDGNWYYFNSWGYMACGGWQYVGSVDYKFSSSGVMVGAWVDVPCYMQYPELPTGCESVALTNLLNYYGFGLSKATIAGHYLPLSWSNNFVTAFAGDPFTGTGGFNGCVAPAIVIAGNNYLSAAGSSLRAVDVSFSSIPALKSRLSCGQPIEVWNTEWGGYPGGRYAASWYNGHSYGLWGGNHAVVLKGYDDEEGIVYVSDSISGDVTRDAKVFFSTWQMMDSQAVVIE